MDSKSKTYMDEKKNKVRLLRIKLKRPAYVRKSELKSILSIQSNTENNDNFSKYWKFIVKNIECSPKIILF